MTRQIELLGRTVYGCGCELCQHIWMAMAPPKRCAKCKGSRWNANSKEVLSEPVPATSPSAMTVSDCFATEERIKHLRQSEAVIIESWGKNDLESLPLPVAEFADDGEPYRASEKPKKRAVGETLASSLCRHQLYAGTCPRCKYGTM